MEEKGKLGDVWIKHPVSDVSDLCSNETFPPSAISPHLKHHQKKKPENALSGSSTVGVFSLLWQMLYYDWKCLTKYYACPLAAEIRICLTFFLLEKQHISIRPSAFFPARPHFFKKRDSFRLHHSPSKRKANLSYSFGEGTWRGSSPSRCVPPRLSKSKSCVACLTWRVKGITQVVR